MLATMILQSLIFIVLYGNITSLSLDIEIELLLLNLLVGLVELVGVVE